MKGRRKRGGGGRKEELTEGRNRLKRKWEGTRNKEEGYFKKCDRIKKKKKVLSISEKEKRGKEEERRMNQLAYEKRKEVKRG